MEKEIKSIPILKNQNLLFKRQMFIHSLKCLPGLIVADFIMTLFSLYLTGNFVAMFTGEFALATAGRMISNMLLLCVLIFGVYVNHGRNLNATRDFYIALCVLAVTYIACLAGAKFVNSYAMPISLIVLVLIILLDTKITQLSVTVAAVMIIINFLFNGEIFTDGKFGEIIASVICNSLAALSISFFAKKHLTRLKFMIAAILASALAFPFIVVSTVAIGDYSIGIAWNILWLFVANVVAVAVFMPVVAILEGVFNIADDFKLAELSNLNNPLLKRLASEAPGTFNHSLVVGNLAEACAGAIGENPNLARCAAYYHDIGKLKAPLYFSENQSTYNPHDELIPEVSVSMITSHTLFGEILAKQYRLPPEIVSICLEHHGTTPISFFYKKALTLTEEGELAVENYKYPGPLPKTKVAAIIMITDTIEAALRAFTPDTKEAFEERVNKLVDEKLALRQFDDCPITMNDIWKIKQVIIEVMPSVHHSRIRYDKTERNNGSKA